jgi:2-dehydro-3-deoxyglucarate aldolase/4-hydroxy-2-oxoheptanedioate aldolase
MRDAAQTLRERFKHGPFVAGGHAMLSDPSIAEAMACFGYDFVWIDAEHGPYGLNQILASITAVQGAGAAALVRVVLNDTAFIKPVLEMGPDGIIIPQVLSAEDVQRAMDDCLYPPAGTRGFGPRRANRYAAVGDAEYLEQVHRSFLRIVQIEHVQAVRDIGRIVQVPYLDAIVIGPYDLSGSVGLLSQTRHPQVLSLAKQTLAACKEAAVPCGVSIGPADTTYIDLWLSMGVDFISCGDDLSFIKMGAEATLRHLKKQ